MRPVSPVIPGTTLPEVTFAENQEEYLNLPALRSADGKVLCRWRMTWKERLRVLVTGNLYVFLLTFNQPLQPIALQTEQPDFGLAPRENIFVRFKDYVFSRLNRGLNYVLNNLAGKE